MCERNTDQFPHMPPTRDPARDPCVCPDWELVTFQFGDDVQLLSHTSQGKYTFFLRPKDIYMKKTAAMAKQINWSDHHPNTPRLWVLYPVRAQTIINQ